MRPAISSAAGQILRWEGNDRQVCARLRQVCQGAGAVDVQKRSVAGKGLGLQGGHQHARLRRQLLRCIHLPGKHDDRLRGEKRGQVVLFHGV